MSRVNEPAPMGPYYGRIRPVEAQQKQAGGDPQTRQGDMLAIHGGQGISENQAVFPAAGSSRAYLVIVGLVAVLIATTAWWGGMTAVVGIGLGWITAMLLWLVRKDIVSEFQELFW
ncbi:MAG: hypothetical protein FJZ00_10440 [Candidatus Sericytochromatia bacterium]|uniref:Uncharacterized protein n=1 Tax=Candidatus Tanganyikabacteria bacterium TaxID=2961651 RepID=A0A937X7G9_9BACT|nr:hypothetical protein [Candidatus Tanganyikabacteria bacterium]